MREVLLFCCVAAGEFFRVTAKGFPTFDAPERPEVFDFFEDSTACFEVDLVFNGLCFVNRDLADLRRLVKDGREEAVFLRVDAFAWAVEDFFDAEDCGSLLEI